MRDCRVRPLAGNTLGANIPPDMHQTSCWECIVRRWSIRHAARGARNSARWTHNGCPDLLTLLHNSFDSRHCF
eukprot:3785232-Amphidinium_carterae.1